MKVPSTVPKIDCSVSFLFLSLCSVVHYARAWLFMYIMAWYYFSLLYIFQGFKREWAPFVLTPDFVYVMGGEEGAMFETYKNLCCRAFLTLRRKADLIINLFSLVG